MKNTIKLLSILIIFTTLSSTQALTHIHAQSENPISKPSFAERIKSIFSKPKKATDDKLQTKKEKPPAKKKSNKMLITLGCGIVITISGVFYLKLNPKQAENLKKIFTGFIHQSKKFSLDLNSLREHMNARQGEVFSGAKFQLHAKNIINDFKTKKKDITIENLRTPIIKALIDNNFDITKKQINSHSGASYFINQVEHGLIDGGLFASDTNKILEVLIKLAIELKDEDFVKTMINEKNNIGNTVLHNLVDRCGSMKSSDTSCSTILNCLPHIRTLLQYGANPEIKDKKNQSAIDLGKEKNINDHYIDIRLSESTEEGQRSYEVEFVNRSGGGDFL